MESPKFATIDQLCKLHPIFNPASIRQYVYHADKYGFNDCVLRKGRKVIIDVEKFEEWVRS